MPITAKDFPLTNDEDAFALWVAKGKPDFEGMAYTYRARAQRLADLEAFARLLEDLAERPHDLNKVASELDAVVKELRA